MTTEELYSIYLKCGACVSTDSRTVGEGELFVALKGENFDGNLYAYKALEAGAGYAVVSEGSVAAAEGGDRIIAVPDTLEALRSLALYHRRHCRADGCRLPVIGMTGTNGKTTTKELIKAVLSAKYAVSATTGNLNNDIGVPQTLLKITPETEIAIVEMGANHPDDIARLVEIVDPDFGLITNVGKAHLLGFGSFDGVKRAKGQLYDYLSAHGGRAFVNVADPALRSMAEERQALEIIPFSADMLGAVVEPCTRDNPFLSMNIGGEHLQTRLVGSYNATNVLAAVAIGLHFGVPLHDALEAIAAYEPANSRSQMVRTPRNTLIVDAYNANPSSMGVALSNFADIIAPCKLALLGDMRELGADSLAEHVAVVRKVIGYGYDAIFVGDEFARAVEETGCAFRTFPDSVSLAEYLRGNPVTDTTVLVKGSRGIMMEKAIPEL